MTRTAEILVGADGSAHSRAAIRWAVAEARQRDCGLLLVHVCQAAGYGLWASNRSVRQSLREQAQPLLDDALQYARSLDRSVPIRTRMILGSPGRVLLALADDLPMIVVGRQGKSSLAAHLLGSVSQSLMTHARCPVVTVAALTDPVSSQRVERVVVAVGDRPTSLQTLRFGVNEARQHSVPLYVVHAWQGAEAPYSPADLSPAPGAEMAAESARLSARVRDTLGADALASLRLVVLTGKPARALLNFSHDGDLLVLGQHRHGRYLPGTLGSVIADVVHQTGCAVAVVSEPAEGEPNRDDDEDQDKLAAGLLAY